MEPYELDFLLRAEIAGHSAAAKAIDAYLELLRKRIRPTPDGQKGSVGKRRPKLSQQAR
jgi:hypothetical protein